MAQEPLRGDAPPAPPGLEIDTRYDPQAIEPRWYATWEERGYFHAEPDAWAGRQPYTIVIPPPNVTGVLHLGHALNNTYQDVLIRWRRMQGRICLWMPGTDHAGIATQNVVEREIWKAEKRSRHDLGREELLGRIWAWKEKNGDTIIRQLKRLGASCDWQRTRFTMDEGLSRAVREVFVRLFEKGLLYRGEYLVNWCPRCETALSDEEAPKRTVAGALYRIKYPIEGEPGRFITVATTRPETMLGDTGVAVHPEDARYKDLVGRTAVLPLLERKIEIVADEYIDPAFGTGALKVTPGHDPHDFEIGRRHGLPIPSVFTARAAINELGGPYRGLDRFAARKKVLEDLKAKDLLEGEEKHDSEVPHCYRCDTVVEYYLSTQWFVRMKPLAEPAAKVVRDGRITFAPERWTGVYLNWMDNIRDWCVSRQIWWGHRIPVWHCKACKGMTCATSDPTACAKCGSAEIEQDPDVLDTWFSSWLWPFSTMGWPEKTRTLEVFYPTDALVTAPEIIFFWVARMIMAGLEFMGEIPFSRVLIHGTVRDEKGRKMSKSLGNAIDPLSIIDEHSADALRLSLALLTPDGQDPKLAPESFGIGRNFCTKLWNAARLILTNLGGFEAGKDDTLANRAEDRWIVSKLHRAILDATAALEALRINDAAQTLYSFVWGSFCDWYLEIVKPRLYADDPKDKRGAQMACVYVLDRALRLLHPFAPFVTEELWQRLKEAVAGDRAGWAESIMIAAFPAPNEHMVDPEIEAQFDLLIALVTNIRNIRATFNIPPGKPLRAIITTAAGSADGGGASLKVAEKNRELVKRLAKLDGIEAAPGQAKPHGAAVAVIKDIEVFVPLEGLIDIEAEKARLRTRLEKLDGQVGSVRKKLDAPGFADKAPADVVAKTRATLTDLASQADRVRANLRDLD